MDVMRVHLHPCLFPVKQDFQIKLLERKMSRLKGDVNTDEKQALEHKTSQLAETLEEKRRTAGLLTTQLKKLQVTISHTHTHILSRPPWARMGVDHSGLALCFFTSAPIFCLSEKALVEPALSVAGFAGLGYRLTLVSVSAH